MQYIIIPDLLFQTGSFGYTNINVHYFKQKNKYKNTKI